MECDRGEIGKVTARSQALLTEIPNVLWRLTLIFSEETNSAING